ncbi:unnamed protein product [Miscanthus lutarioriparius]|uniref:Non-haem dioxygenase N-terminal domain-containing protein n=1 Tax=Miscanthus lutarioriparius TaxID=422564 RepID=A0A811RLR1_9POAL|nr:unnamed protein product [Miscanthus lutarioriparius]
MSTTEEAAGGYGYDRLCVLKAFDDTKAGGKGLVDAGVTTVPAIFRHHRQDRPPVSPSSSSGITISVIPVIDLSVASAADAAARAEVVAQVKAAAETVGFFQLEEAWKEATATAKASASLEGGDHADVLTKRNSKKHELPVTKPAAVEES